MAPISFAKCPIIGLLNETAAVIKLIGLFAHENSSFYRINKLNYYYKV
jgi:hypothetical protein